MILEHKRPNKNQPWWQRLGVEPEWDQPEDKEDDCKPQLETSFLVHIPLPWWLFFCWKCWGCSSKPQASEQVLVAKFCKTRHQCTMRCAMSINIFEVYKSKNSLHSHFILKSIFTFLDDAKLPKKLLGIKILSFYFWKGYRGKTEGGVWQGWNFSRLRIRSLATKKSKIAPSWWKWTKV